MIDGEIVDEYRRLSSKERTTVHRWFVTNAVVGVLSILALIAVTSFFSGRDSGSASADKPVIQHAEAR